MSIRKRSGGSARQRSHAPVFAALGDDTRLALLTKLGGGRPQSISELSADYRLTRQAITKHLRVLQDAGLVHSTRRGRENQFRFDPKPVDEARQYLDRMSAQWDQALLRLKSLVEE